jgi:DNA invertase Pin-like site-specific DNA recombinase
MRHKPIIFHFNFGRNGAYVYFFVNWTNIIIPGEDKMVYGYVRVSTKDQREDRQLNAMKDKELSIDKVFIDKQSGKDFDRCEYKKLMKKLKCGDVLIVKSIDRLGRNYNEVLEQWRIITKVKGVDIIVLDMPILDTTKNKDLLGTLISDLVLQLLSYVAQNERESIKQRQAEGIAAAKARGIKFGRPRIKYPENYKEILNAWSCGKIETREVLEALCISRTTFYRLIKAENCRKITIKSQ